MIQKEGLPEQFVNPSEAALAVCKAKSAIKVHLLYLHAGARHRLE